MHAETKKALRNCNKNIMTFH